MKLIDNINSTLNDDLKRQLRPGSRLSIAASCFSIYAFQELKEQLKDIKELRFIFTSPTFTTDRTPKQQREFYIPRLNRERTVYSLEEQIQEKLEREKILKQLAVLEKQCRSEKQPRRKYELHQRIIKLKEKLK